MNGLTEQDYAEAFGVELPGEGGETDGAQEPVENGTGGAGEEGAAQEPGTEAMRTAEILLKRETAQQRRARKQGRAPRSAADRPTDAGRGNAKRNGRP